MIMADVIAFEKISDLDLAQTLDCGQSFRWSENGDGSFSGIAFGRSVRVRLDGDTLYIENAPREDAPLWRSYFDLDLDYGEVRRGIAEIHPILREASEYAGGIRILRQEPYEALCTFIISQNNNIKRIKGIVARLCESFGKGLPDGGYAFPRWLCVSYRRKNGCPQRRRPVAAARGLPRKVSDRRGAEGQRG